MDVFGLRTFKRQLGEGHHLIGVEAQEDTHASPKYM